VPAGLSQFLPHKDGTKKYLPQAQTEEVKTMLQLPVRILEKYDFLGAAVIGYTTWSFNMIQTQNARIQYKISFLVYTLCMP
jgi:hypothetical protein